MGELIEITTSASNIALFFFFESASNITLDAADWPNLTYA